MLFSIYLNQIEFVPEDGYCALLMNHLLNSLGHARHDPAPAFFVCYCASADGCWIYIAFFRGGKLVLATTLSSPFYIYICIKHRSNAVGTGILWIAYSPRK